MVRDIDLGDFGIKTMNSVRKKYRNDESRPTIWE